MTTYIDVESAIGKLLTVDDQYSAERDFAVNAINSEAAADVQPVVHARYIERGFDNYECSNCGVHCHVDNVCTIYDNYCPNCGAKMDGDEHE